MKIIDIEIFKQTTDHTCGPAALRAFLSHYNVKPMYTEQELTKMLYTCPQVGTKFEVINAFLKSIGINAVYKDNRIMPNIKYLIDQGKIILTEWIDWGGHFVIICGYDDTHYYLADPESGVVTKESQDRFTSMWFTKQEKYACYLHLS